MLKASLTAAVLVIGDEILSGRTRDTNSGHIAAFLTEIGIDLREVRVVPDDQDMIVEAVTLETGKPATVSKSLVDNDYKLAFGLPRGGTGAGGGQFTARPRL